jgi:protein O-GlcNAc transferase
LLTLPSKKSTKKIHNLKNFATALPPTRADNATPQGKRTLEDVSNCGQKGDYSLRALGMPMIAQALNTAQRFQQEGQFQQAEFLYRQVLHVDPGNAEAHFNLGFVLKKQGKLNEAAASYEQAIRLKPQNAEAHNNLGNIFLECNNLDQAALHFQQALRFDPRNAQAHNNLGIVFKKLGRLNDAAASYQQALLLKPDFDRAHSNLGNILQEQGKLEQASACYRKALACNPRLGAVHLNLGALLRAQGKLEEAADCARQAVQQQPDLAEAYLHLGAILQEQGRADEAVAAYRQALRLKPNSAEPYYNLGGLLAGQNNFDDAVANYRQALRLKPDMAEAHTALGQVLGDREGKTAEGMACLQEALRLKPSARLRIALATCQPVIYQSVAELESWRGRLVKEVRELREQNVVHDVTDETVVNLFYLAYQGLNDRDIQREVARLHQSPRMSGVRCPVSGVKGISSYGHRTPDTGHRTVRVGFLSSFFRRHTIGLLMGGLVEQLSRREFEVIVLSVGRYEDEVAAFFKQHADRFVEIPRHLPTARRLILEQSLNVLFYTDIGMDPVTSTLAHSRLAPVQCTTWGHPVTTGIDTVDYFISSEALETEEAAQHYTEKLIKLKTLPIYYYRPELSRPVKGREAFGLTADAHVYACPQNLIKLHPDFDEVAGGILRGDPRGVLVLGWGLAAPWEGLLRQRFATTLPDVVDRIRFLPRLNRPEFLNFMAVSDVLLDPIHFGGGNTSYEGLALGAPIVTLPSRFLRGRITFALYKQMGMLECVVHSPQEYVELAQRLGTDKGYRDQVRDRILEGNGVLYQNSAGVKELEEFFKAESMGSTSRTQKEE